MADDRRRARGTLLDLLRQYVLETQATGQMLDGTQVRVVRPPAAMVPAAVDVRRSGPSWDVGVTLERPSGQGVPVEVSGAAARGPFRVDARWSPQRGGQAQVRGAWSW